MRSILLYSIYTLLFFQFSIANSECLKFGIVPYEDSKNIREDFTRLSSWMESERNKCLELVVAKDYSQTIKNIAENRVDCSKMGPFSYVLANKIVELDPIVTEMVKGGRFSYRSYLVATPKLAKELKIEDALSSYEGMERLKELLEGVDRELVVGFTDEGSTSGYAIPSFYMEKAGIDKSKEFKKSLFLGNHDSSQLAVKNGLVDLSFGSDGSYNKLMKEGKIDKDSNIIIWKSDDIPNSPIVCRSSLGVEKIEEIRDLFLGIPTEYIPNFRKVLSYVRSDKSMYKIIEEIDLFLSK